MNFDVEDVRYKNALPKIAKHFKAEVVEDCDQYSFSFDNDLGKGRISAINYEDGMSVVMVDALFNEDVQITYRLGRRHPILFLYNRIGQLAIMDKPDSAPTILQPHEAIIYAPKGDHDYSLKFNAHVKTKIVFTSVIRFLFLNKIECDLNALQKPLSDMFKDTVGKNSFEFQTISEPSILTSLDNLFVSKQKGLERKLLIEAKSLELITHLLSQFKAEGENKIAGYRITKTDISNLNKAKNILINNFNEVPKIDGLAQMVGMNSNKLQKGFQLVFGKSIRQFVISYRMHKALNLLKENELNISEIAHYVGYINKGHFSKLFKLEFGILPSSYHSRVEKFST